MGKRSNRSGSDQDPFIIVPRTGRPIGRREFVRTSSGLFVAATLGSACAEANSPDAGKVQVTIFGLPTTGLTSAGSATISGDGISPITLPLPPIATGEASVRAGTYQVVYTPPTGFAMAQGSANSVEVEVRPGETTEVEFEVVAATGTLRITVTGLAGASDGGSAQVALAAGGTSQTVNIPVSGTVDTTIVPGTYTVTYSAPGGHQVAAGEQNPKNVVVGSAGVGTATFQVSQVSAPQGVLFSSFWSSGLGASAAAVSDGGKWGVIGGVGHEVIASTSLDFPTPNVLRITAQTSNSGYALVRKTGMPVGATPFSRYYRWYYRHAKVSISGGNNQHPIQDGNAQSQTNWTFNVNQIDNSTYRVNIGVGPSTPEGLSRWQSPVLNVNQTYRWELHYHALSASQCRVHVRVYTSSSSTPHLTDTNFANSVGGQGGTLAADPILQVNNLAALDGLNCGVNGVSNLTQNQLHSYQAAFAVGDTTWLGPFAQNI